MEQQTQAEKKQTPQADTPREVELGGRGDVESGATKSLPEIADWLETWTKSNGRKHRKWAKLPVGAVKECCESLRVAQSASWASVGEKVRSLETQTAYLLDLIERMTPHVEAAAAFAKRGTEIKLLQGSSPAIRDAFRLKMQDMAAEAEKLAAEASKVVENA